MPWTGLTGNSKGDVKFTFFRPLTMLHSRVQIVSAAKTRSMVLFNLWKLVHGSAPVSRLSLSLAITSLNPLLATKVTRPSSADRQDSSVSTRVQAEVRNAETTTRRLSNIREAEATWST
jgi:hypothetical protein